MDSRKEIPQILTAQLFLGHPLVEMSIPELFARCRLKAKRNQLFDYKTGIISYLQVIKSR